MQLVTIYRGIAGNSFGFSAYRFMSNKSSIDKDEIDKFNRLADEWWDPYGKFKPLHRMNPKRMEFIREFIKEPPSIGTRILDVGCGGGILSESLARLGFSVNGIDAAVQNIRVAQSHASQHKSPALAPRLIYECTTTEDLVRVQSNLSSYDILCAMEIVEHVSNVADFVSDCVQLVKPGGFLFFSTINRHPGAYFLAILAAEYLLRLVPKGTHSYEKFVRPQELIDHLEKAGCSLIDLRGISYNPLTERWSWASRSYCNYMTAFRKKD